MSENPVVEMIQKIRTRVRKDLYGGTLNYESSMNLLRRQIGVAERLDNVLLKGQILETMGTVEMERGNFQDGYNYYEQALVAMEAVGDLYRVGVMLNNLGEALRRWGNPEAARDNYLRARELAEQEDVVHLVITTYNNEGQLWLSQGNIERAIEVLETGLQLALDNDWNQNTVQSTMPELRSSLAEAYTLKGDYATGWSHVERALAVAQEFKQLDQVALAYKIMALIAIREQNPDHDPAYYFALSRENYEQMGAMAELGRLLVRAGDYWASVGEHAKAKQAHDEALSLLEQAQMTIEVEKLRGRLASE